MPVAELLLALLSVGIALLCFAIGAIVVPRISLSSARRSTAVVRAAAAAFSILGGLVNLQLAGHVLLSSQPVGASELVLPALQFLGGALAVLVILRYLKTSQGRMGHTEGRVRELERLALHDPLTGVHNRRYFDEALRREVHRYRRYGRPVSVVLFDVDDLKAINDRGGHGAGDRALLGIADAAGELVRAADSLARLGGDEFALLLPETDQPRALIVAERLRATVERLPVDVAGRASVSVGVASIPHDGQSAEELQAGADQALYWVKRHGKNRCATAGPADARGSKLGSPAARAS